MFSKFYCIFNNVYVIRIDDLEKSMRCYILNPFANFRFALFIINTIMVKIAIGQATIMKYKFHFAQP